MTPLDWMLVFGLNGAIIAYALVRGRETDSSSDWFLAGRTLPWWMIGLSLYATAIDSTDLVVDAGAVYGLGMRHYVLNWAGVICGWVLLAHFVAPPMYRAGMYTNAEYLEARFGTTARVISVLVQVLYRTVIIGMIATANYLTLMIVCEWSSTTAWTAVASVALLATIYTMVGGLKAVAVTDAYQSVVMLAASVVLFVIVWNHVGGWTGIERKLTDHDPQLAEQMLHAGSPYIERESTVGMPNDRLARKLTLGGEFDEQQQAIIRRTPAWMVSLTMIIVGLAYAIVNHSESMRLFGARSLWDLKMSVLPACLILLVVTFLNLTMGIMGKAIHPEVHLLPVEPVLQKIDSIYPILIRDLSTVGFKGIIVAGLFAASFSTYDSIGSALSALITRDVYGRLLVTDRNDSHYLAVGRLLTPVIIFGSFAYIPALLKEGMIFFYLDIVGAFVVPLLTVYLMGIFTRVHRISATVGLLVGGSFGLLTLFGPWLAEEYGVTVLPAALFGRFVATPASMLLTAGCMLAVSLVLGWEGRADLLHKEHSTWLRESQQQVARLAETGVPSTSYLPLAGGILVIIAGLLLSFVIFW